MDGWRVGGESSASAGELELRADDRGVLDHHTLGGPEPIESRGEQGEDRRRHGALSPVPALLDRVGAELLEEERVAFRQLERVSTDSLGKPLVGEEPFGELRRLVRRQPVEQDAGGVELGAAPCGPLLEEVGAREAQKEDGGGSRAIGDVLDQVEQRRFGPVDVFEDEDEWPVDGELLEQAPDREEALLEAAAAAIVEAE